MALYVVFAFIALAIDRRALLVSSLAYVLYALSTLFQQAGAVELSMAFTALVIGSALLTLSAFWQPMRAVGGRHAGRPRRPPAAGAAADVARLSSRLAGADLPGGSRLPGVFCPLDQLHQPPLDRRQHRAEFVPALQHRALLADQRPHALPVAQRRALLDPELGPLGGAAEGGEDRRVAAQLDRIVAPVPGRDHPAVEIEDAGQLDALEPDLARRARRQRKRRDDSHQARSRSASSLLGEQRVEPLAQRLELAAHQLELLRRGIEHARCTACHRAGTRAVASSASTIVARAGMPTITAPSGTSLVTTALAPIRAPRRRP